MAAPWFWTIKATSGGAGIVFTNKTNGFILIIGIRPSAGVNNVQDPAGNNHGNLSSTGSAVFALLGPGWSIANSGAATVTAYGLQALDIEDLRGYF